MPELQNTLTGLVDVNRSFAEQENIQLFLEYPCPQENATVVPSNLLYKFLLIADKALADERKRLGLQRVLSGVKLGYERKVCISNSDDSCRVDSQFVANRDWRIEFETGLSSQVEFLVPSLAQEDQNIGEIETQSDPLKEYLIKLTEACADELYRIFPQLKDCLEIHIYIFVNFYETSTFFSSSGLGGKQITLAARSCPGCWEDTERTNWNSNKKGEAGNCQVCSLTN